MRDMKKRRKAMTLLSLDVGLTGGLAFFKDGKLVKTKPMPVLRVCIQEKLEQQDLKDGKKQIIKSGPNKGKVKMKLRRPAKYKNKLDISTVMSEMMACDYIVIGQQGCQMMNSTKACSTTMFNYGQLIAAAELSQIPYEEVLPQVWKKDMHLTMTKDEKLALKGDKALITKTLKAKAISQAQHLTGKKFITPKGAMLDGEAEAF